MMNTFEAMGNAQLLAVEGQRAIAAALLRAVKTGLGRLLQQLANGSTGPLWL